jgi:single-strand DNA-binding protein
MNKVILIGRVGGDPLCRKIGENNYVAQFSIATTDRAFTTKEGKEIPERTEWHKIVIWGALAEKVVAKYVQKGTHVSVLGANRTKKYTDKNGVERWTTSVVCDYIELLSRGSVAHAQAAIESSFPKPIPQLPNMPPIDPLSGGMDIEDDLPF